ncbi:MAG: hypothetical protein VYC34_01515 [Planctomycetota bacterium]|nr:hypothetical protein [Planctomycetota bacterium]
MAKRHGRHDGAVLGILLLIAAISVLDRVISLVTGEETAISIPSIAAPLIWVIPILAVAYFVRRQTIAARLRDGLCSRCEARIEDPTTTCDRCGRDNGKWRRVWLVGPKSARG